MSLSLSGSLCAAAMWRSSISTPASEPTSFTSWLGFSYDEIGMPLISKQSLLRYCWVSSRAHSTRYSDWSCLSIAPASSLSFSSSEFVIVVYFLLRLAVWLIFNTFESSYGTVIFLGNKILRLLHCVTSLGYCAFHKHANSKIQKPPSQLRFSLPSIIITITSNEPWNTETHKTDRNPPITDHKPWPFEPI